MMMTAPPDPTNTDADDDDLCVACGKPKQKHNFKEMSDCENFIEFSEDGYMLTQKEKEKKVGKKEKEKCPNCNFDMIEKFANRMRCPNCNYEERYDD